MRYNVSINIAQYKIINYFNIFIIDAMLILSICPDKFISQLVFPSEP